MFNHDSNIPKDHTGGYCMKSLIFLGVFFSITSAFAAGEFMESRFHLLSMKCEAEAGDSLETSPQSPPLDVDDPGTPGCNKWEINLLTNGDFTRAENKFELPLLDINFGIGDNLQLKYEVPMEKTQSSESSHSNVGNSKVGVKYMFFEDEESKLQVAFYPQMDFVTPGPKDSNIDLESSGNIVTLPFLLSKKIGETKKGDVMLTANVGYNISSRADTKNSVFLLTGIGMPLLKKISMMGELSTEQALKKNSDDIREQLVKANFGLVAPINKRFFLYGSLGRSLFSSDGEKHTYALAGIRFVTDALEK